MKTTLTCSAGGPARADTPRQAPWPSRCARRPARRDQGWLAARVLVGMLGAEEGEREGEEGRKKTMLEEVR
eukprot:2688822-Rhodomonas_salina.4